MARCDCGFTYLDTCKVLCTICGDVSAPLCLDCGEEIILGRTYKGDQGDYDSDRHGWQCLDCQQDAD